MTHSLNNEMCLVQSQVITVRNREETPIQTNKATWGVVSVELCLRNGKGACNQEQTENKGCRSPRTLSGLRR